MIKKILGIVLSLMFIAFFITSCDFNLFAPQDMGDVIANLPADEQLDYASDALANAETSDDAAAIAVALKDDWDAALADGADDADEAEAAMLIATATILSDPILFEGNTIITNLASGAADASDLSGIFSSLSEDPAALADTIAALADAAAYTNYAAEYNQGSGDELDANLQIMNALFNVVAAADSSVSDWTNETDVQNAFDGIDLSSPSTAEETAAAASLNAIISDPDASQTLKDLANTLLSL